MVRLLLLRDRDLPRTPKTQTKQQTRHTSDTTHASLHKGPSYPLHKGHNNNRAAAALLPRSVRHSSQARALHNEACWSLYSNYPVPRRGAAFKTYVTLPRPLNAPGDKLDRALNDKSSTLEENERRTALAARRSDGHAELGPVPPTASAPHPSERSFSHPTYDTLPRPLNASVDRLVRVLFATTRYLCVDTE